MLIPQSFSCLAISYKYRKNDFTYILSRYYTSCNYSKFQQFMILLSSLQRINLLYQYKIGNHVFYQLSHPLLCLLVRFQCNREIQTFYEFENNIISESTFNCQVIQPSIKWSSYSLYFLNFQKIHVFYSFNRRLHHISATNLFESLLVEH